MGLDMAIKSNRVTLSQKINDCNLSNLCIKELNDLVAYAFCQQLLTPVLHNS